MPGDLNTDGFRLKKYETWQGVAGRGDVRLGEARHGEARLFYSRHGTARRGEVWPGTAGLFYSWQGQAGQDLGWNGKVRRGEAKRGKAGQGKNMESKIIKELLRLGAYFIIIQLFLPHPDFANYNHIHAVDYFSKAEVESICRMVARDEAEDIALDTISSHIIGEH